ncbi:hypothetical protein FRC03_000411, partial [Tulasnella sp. 419]
IIYQPKTKYYEGNKKPPAISDGFFSWISPVIHTKEPELLEKIGLDAVAFLRFLRLMRWLFLIVGVLSAAVLMPIDYKYNLDKVSARKRNILTMLTIQNVRGWQLYVHVGASYVITFIVLFFVWWHWRKMVQLRNLWFRSDEYQKSFYARTLMILQVPKKLQSDQGLKSLLDNLQVPYPTSSVRISRRVGRLPELVEYHNQTVRELEHHLVRYLKGGKIGKKRPTVTIGGFLGLGGTKKDAIEYYTAKLRMTEQAVLDDRAKIDVNKVENYGFASMAAVPYAHVVAKLLQNKSPKGTEITLAPNPKDIIWRNITKSDFERARLRTFGWIWITVLCAFNTVPLLLISGISNLAAMTQYVKFLDNWSDSSPSTFSAVSGILPPTIMALFGYILPILMRKLSKYQGALTRTRLDRAVVARYFAFLIISQLFVFSLIGVAFSTAGMIQSSIQEGKSFQQIIQELGILPQLIQKAYVEQSSYWLTWFPLRGFLAVFDMAQLINLIYIGIRKRLFGRTPREITEWTQPPAFEFAIYFSNMLFMGAIALIYAPLAPLVPLAAAVVFWVSGVVYKYQLMFVFISKVESGGRLWNVVMNRLMAALLFMHALMTLTIGLQTGWTTYKWVMGLPPAVIVICFKIFIRRYDNQFRYFIPSDSDIATAKVHSMDNVGRLEKRFGHPALHEELFTPHVHSNMMPLLSQVYHGRLDQSSARLAEYHGAKMEAQIAPGGIKIAGIAQADLEYDLAMYQRDRGEQDWETRSMSSSNMLQSDRMSIGGSTLVGSTMKGQHPAGYDSYMAHGPTYHHKTASGSEIEMSRLGTQDPDATPLLTNDGQFGHQQTRSRSRLDVNQQSYDLGDGAHGHYYHQDNQSFHSYGPGDQPMQPADPYAQGYNQPPPPDIR